MIIKSYELKKNIKKNVNFYLLYGQNNGLIEEVINKNLKSVFSKNIYTYEESEILSDIDNFHEKIFNRSFFENDKLLIINRVTDKILEVIKEIFERKIEDLNVILKSGSLEKKSKLRIFFEKNPDLIIVPFYEDTHQSLQFIAQNFFKEKKIKISTENINYIVEKSKGSRINLKNDLEKISSFSQNKPALQFEDILKLSTSAENYAISELTDQCLVKNKKKTINILNENNPSMEDNILILKSFLFKLKRLKKLKKEIENNKDQEQAISSFRPPIFWKDKIIIKEQLKVWSLIEIKSFIKRINNLELIIKKNSQISNQLINDFIIQRLTTPNN